ncbi:MAG: ATP-binding protein [Proteobacteria bacterium]|nr:ATP-binding protein [Pseudomonadota bacterium]
MHATRPVSCVTTVPDRCRVCFTCVRECPAKAIRIENGQAEVMPERCIACGNCVRVCSQEAKQFCSASDAVFDLIRSGEKVAACLAPSFPAEFPGISHQRVVGMLRKLGFHLVTEVAFGADLVASRYRKLISEHPDQRFIATTCPAVYRYVELYFPDAIDNLAPIVSPMVATARALRAEHGADLRVVFIGPCVAKKMEADDDSVAREIQSVLTFHSLKKMLRDQGIRANNTTDSEFDPPFGGLGALFPLCGGMLQAADIREDLLKNEVVTVDGLSAFTSSISEFSHNTLDARLLEVLACNGCIMGPGMTSEEPHFKRRSRVSRYVQLRRSEQRDAAHERDLKRFIDLDLSRTFEPNDQRPPRAPETEISEILLRLGKREYSDELNCGACGYDTCREHAVAIHLGLAEDEMCLPYIIDRLKVTIKDLSDSHAQLATTQDQLMHSEKLASMGQLAAGVAHELNNPLGVVLMYSHLLLDELDTQSPVYDDLKMIAEQAQRSKKIVANLLDFARENKALIEEINIENLIRHCVDIARLPEGVSLHLDFAHSAPHCELDPDQMIQVFTNLIQNAVSAMNGQGTLHIRTQDTPSTMHICIQDTGCGIPPEHRQKIFQPFFTTKKIGKGTGLGLAVSYGIVKMHRGDIAVSSNTNPEVAPTGTAFTIKLPRRHAQPPTSKPHKPQPVPP